MIGADSGATERERALLHQTAALLNLDLPLGRLMQRLCTVLRAYVDVPLIYFALVRHRRGNGARLEYAYECGVERTRDASISERPDSRRAMASDSSILRTSTDDGSPRSRMTIPVRGAHGVSGVLVLEAARENAFDSEDLRSLEAVARFLGIGIRSRRAIGIASRLRRTPVIAAVVIASLVLLTFFLIIDYYGRAQNVHDRALATQRERARVVAHDLDSTLLVAQQIARSSTAVLPAIRADRRRMESTMYRLFAATPADTIHGLGIWFEPQAFDRRTDRFALYVHRNPGGADVVTDKYATRAYNYLRRDWYRDGERALGNPIFTPPNVDTEVAVISVVQGFYDRPSGRFGGDVTVNLGVPLLRATIRHYNDVPGRIVYVADANGSPFVFPQPGQLTKFAHAHVDRTVAGPLISGQTVHDYIARTQPGPHFEVTAPVRNAGWVVHVTTLNDRLDYDLLALRNELGRTLGALWIAGAVCLLMLRLRYVHARGRSRPDRTGAPRQRKRAARPCCAATAPRRVRRSAHRAAQSRSDGVARR